MLLGLLVTSGHQRVVCWATTWSLDQLSVWLQGDNPPPKTLASPITSAVFVISIGYHSLSREKRDSIFFKGFFWDLDVLLFWIAVASKTFL